MQRRRGDEAVASDPSPCIAMRAPRMLWLLEVGSRLRTRWLRRMFPVSSYAFHARRSRCSTDSPSITENAFSLKPSFSSLSQLMRRDRVARWSFFGRGFGVPRWQVRRPAKSSIGNRTAIALASPRLQEPAPMAGPRQGARATSGIRPDFFPVDPKKVAREAGLRRGTESGCRAGLIFFDAGRRTPAAGLFWHPPKKSPFLAPQKSQKSRQQSGVIGH